MPDLFTAAQREERREPAVAPIIWEPPGLAGGQTEALAAGEVSSQSQDYWTPPPVSQSDSSPSPSGISEPGIEESAQRIERLAQKRESEAVEVDRSLPEEIGASVVRGALGIAKLPFQVAKIVGSDVLGSETVKKATVPIIESLEAKAESPDWKPSKWAGGKPIDLDRLISDPGEVIGQITSQISNPRFWASQLPEGAMSMIPAFVGAWAPRAVAYAGKLGTALKAARAAGRTEEIAEIGRKLNRLSTIGMFGASMAMEAGQAEEKVREYELRHPDKPISWGNRVVSILGTGVVAGGLEALSFGRVFMGKYGGEVSLQAMVKEVMNGKGGGLLARKVIDSVATEGVTEGAQTLVENWFAKNGYDVDQKLTEGIVESVLIGAALGGVGGTFTGLNVRGKAIKEAAARIQETKRLAEEEYQSTLQAAEEGAALGEVLAERPGPQEVAPEPTVAPVMERQAPQPTTPTPEEQHWAIFGNRFAENLPRADAIRALVPEMGSHDRAERFYDLYEQGDAATALKEFPEFSAWATPAQREVARGLPPAFGGKPRPQPSPMGVTGAEVAERASVKPDATGFTQTEEGKAAFTQPAPPPAPMGVAGAAAEDLAAAQHRGEVGGKEVVEEVLGPIREQVGTAPGTRLQELAAQEVEGRLARGEEVEPEVLAKLAAKYGEERPGAFPPAAAPVEAPPFPLPSAFTGRRTRPTIETAMRTPAVPPEVVPEPKVPQFKPGDQVVAKGENIPAYLRGTRTVEHAFNEAGIEYIQVNGRHFLASEFEAKGEAPVAPTFNEGDRVSFTGAKGEELTGTIEGEVREGKADISVDQAATIQGRVPIGRVEVGVSTDKLTKIKEGPAEAAQEAADAHGNIAGMVKNFLALTADPITSQQLFSWADERYGGTQAEGKYTPKDAYDAMELGVNQFIKSKPELFNPQADKPARVIANLEKLISRLPTQTRRTSEADEFQQFSTPPPLAYLVNWVANIGQNDVVLEPSAGVGGLAVFARNAGAKEVIVNELSPRRVNLLREMRFNQVFTENAEQLNNILPKEIKPSVVLMNPPFSSTAGRMFGKRVFQTGAAHIEQALKRLEPGGRLVAIVGRGMAFDKPTFTTWWGKIKKEYKVLANVGISGKNYAKYGTTFDNQILIIDKTGPTTNESVTGVVTKIEDLIPLLEGVKDERTRPELARSREAEPGAPESTGETGAVKRPGIAESRTPVSPTAPRLGHRKAEGERTATAKPSPAAPVGTSESDRGSHGSMVSEERHASVRGERGGRRGEPVPAGAGEPGGAGGGPAGPVGQPADRGGSVSGPVREGLRLETIEAAKAKGELTDSLYEFYHPQRLKIPGAQPHPGHLVQSAAMAAVEPPVPTYKPHLPKEIIDSGKLSEAQLESVVYAGQAHQDTLPNGQRRGFFIGDGTGVGKGREVSGIIYDNWRQGRTKAVWISEKSGLFKDARRDIGGIGWDPNLVFELGKVKADTDIKYAKGILFTTYDTLKSSAKLPKEEEGKGQRRIDQLAEWLGKDFDGTIIFDEAHNMANAKQTKGSRGYKKPSMKALAGLELQDLLPNARIVYVSATGATEVRNLVYAQRLGLWGEGTPFPNSTEFINEIESGGVAAMELVARDLKAMGQYISRSLAFEAPGNPDQTVTYNRMIHTLSDQQVEVYNELARAWQLVLQNIHAAMEETGAGNDRKSKGNAASQFWGTHQRFFNQVITSMQMPAVIEGIYKDLEAGNAVLVQLTNTNEAQQERALGRQAEEEDLDGLDLTPRESLMQYVEHAFPTTQFESYTEEEGNEKWRAVYDSNGNPVQNAEAVRMKEELLEKLGAVRVPDGPLEILLNSFGPEKVAEATGRKRRLIKEGGETILEKRGRAKVEADIAAFLDDKKPILVFSDMAGTGRSFNASYEFKNQRKRVHYGVQLGWRADIAVQKMGRSHRSNQRFAPHYVLVSTNLDGQKRFLSSIARRLDQLGALTKGQRQTGSTGLFQAKDNLESTHARDALRQFYHDLYLGDIPGMDLGTFQEQTGLRLIDDDGNLLQDLPPITQFLNRLLSMQVHDQNRTFTAFQERVERAAEVATRRGTLDVGMETLRPEPGGRIEKANEQLVFTEPRTGAETKYVEVDEINPTKIRTFADSEAIGGSEAAVYYRNVRSGRIWVRERRSWNETQSSGTVVRNWTLYGPLSRSWQDVPESAFYDKEKWEEVPKKEARKLWEAEIAKAPKEESYRHHLITGTILPIWDRLKGSTRVIRTQTAEGERFIGRRIPGHSVDQVLRNLGAKETGKEKGFTPQQIHENILDKNYVVTLANGWEIKHSRVAGEDRIELIGPDYMHLSELQRAGAFTERIQWNTRFFIPAGESGVGVIEKIIKHRPVVTAVPRASSQAKYKIARAFGIKPKNPIDQARQSLAAEYNVAPEKLQYIGDWEAEPGFTQGLHLFNIMDPKHPQFRSTAAWPMGEEAPVLPSQGKPLTAETIQAAFGPQAQVTPSLLIPDVHEVTLPNGTKILVRQNAQIKIKPEILEAYGKKRLEPGEEVIGEWNTMTGTNIISLAKGAGTVTINHEIFHGAMELALSKRERAAILKEYGNEESAARAYEVWNPQERPHTLFQKILDFFQRLVEFFRPTVRGTFGKIKSGEVWERKGKKGLPAGIAPAKYRLRDKTEAVLEEYHRDTLAADPSQKSLWRRFWDRDPGLKESWTELKEKVYDQVVDRYAPGERAQEKLAKVGIALPAGERFTSTVAFWRGQEGWNHEAVMGEGVFHDPVETTGAGESFFSGVAPTRVGDSLFKRVDPIRDLAQTQGMESKEVFRDLNLLMVANKDLELSGEVGIREPGKIKGTRPEESRAVLNALETKYGEDLKVLERVGGKWNADGSFTPGLIQGWADQAILQRLLQGGIISQKLYDKIKAQNQAYIPFMRLMEELDQYIGATGGGKVIKEIKGSERAILNPFQMLIELAAKANYAYARNRMIWSLYQMGQASPEMGITELKSKMIPGIPKARTSPFFGLPTKEKTWAWSQLPPEKGAIPFYKDGKQSWLKLPPDLYQMTQNMMPEDLGLLMRVLKWPADVLRTGAVTTPEFGLVKNPIRDLIQAWLFNRAGFSPLKWGRDLYLSLSHDPDTMKMRAEMAAGGGFMATLAQSTVEEKITAADIEGKKKNVWYASHPVEALRMLSAYLENLTRFSLYKQARENGLSHGEAIHEARRTTLDFRRLGAHPVARYLNMIIPFWNANIQGVDKLVTELTGPNKAAVWRRIGTLTAASIGLALLFHDDDRIKELEDWEKNYFWHIPLGKDGPIIRIPKPFEAGILFGSVPERLVEIAKGDNATGLQAALRAAYDALTPEMIPAALRPFVELKSNYNFFLGRPIEDASLQNLPVELRSKPWTTELAKKISGYGGHLIGLSPVKVEHFVRSFSGGLGANYYFPAADVLLRKAGILEDLPNPYQEVIEKVFGIRAFFAKPPTGYRAKSVGDFFDNYQQIVQGDQGWKILWNTGSMNKLDDFLKANPEAMFAKMARKQMDKLGEIKKERNAIYLSKTLGPEQKKIRLDALDEKVTQLVKAGNALMDPEVARVVGMPSRFKRDAFGTRKSMDLDGYYKFTVESVGDAYEGIQKELPRLLRMDDASRQRFLVKAIREAREGYQPLLKKPEDVLKPYRFQNLLDKPTRKERAAWQSMFGVKKIPPGMATGYRLNDEEARP